MLIDALRSDDLLGMVTLTGFPRTRLQLKGFIPDRGHDLLLLIILSSVSARTRPTGCLLGGWDNPKQLKQTNRLFRSQ